MADIRERVRAVETTIPYLRELVTERQAAQDRRMHALEANQAVGHRRMDGLDSRLAATERAVAPLPGLEARLSYIERRWAGWKAGLQYAAAALIVGLVLARKMTIDQAVMLLKLLLPLSPG